MPIMLAPMAGASAPALSIAVANAGGLGACGAVLMQPGEITAWAGEVRSHTRGPFQINLWIPDPEPVRDESREARVRRWNPLGFRVVELTSEPEVIPPVATAAAERTGSGP